MKFATLVNEVNKIKLNRMIRKIWNNFKNGYVRLTILTIVSISGGLCMLIVPEKISDWIIRVVGLGWTLEGISYGLEIWNKYLRSKR